MAKPSPHELIQRELARHFWPSSRVLVAVSSGADSVALLRALTDFADVSREQLVVAHLNHGLRFEADADERFVVALAKEFGVACQTEKADVASLANQQGDGIEAAARAARYQFFIRTAQQFNAGLVVTAHTADDSAETILQRIIRGTGLDGLRGIQPRRRLTERIEVCRPLLGLRRRVLREYLEQLGQSYREDGSNLDLSFTRNRIRHELLPLLRDKYNPRAVESLLRLAEVAAAAQTIVQACVDQVYKQVQVTRADADRIEIDFAGAKPQEIQVLREFLRDVWRKAGWPEQAMGLHEWDQLAVLAMDHAASNQYEVDRVKAANVEAARNNTVTDNVDWDDESGDEATLHWPHLAQQPPRKIMLPGTVTAEKRGRVLTLRRG